VPTAASVITMCNALLYDGHIEIRSYLVDKLRIEKFKITKFMVMCYAARCIAPHLTRAMASTRRIRCRRTLDTFA